MKPEDQSYFDVAVTWLIYLVMSTLGALANYADKVDRGEKFSILTLILRWFIAAFASSLVGFYGELQAWDKRFIFILCGMAGYMGVTVIKMIERVIKSRFSGNTPEENKQ